MNDEIVTCGVCLGVLQGATQLGCGHALCGRSFPPLTLTTALFSSDMLEVGCVIAIFERLSPLCPYCRTEIRSASPSFNLRQVVDALPPAVGHEADEQLDAETIAIMDRNLKSFLPGAGSGGVEGKWMHSSTACFSLLTHSWR